MYSMLEIVELIEVDLDTRTEMGGRKPKIINRTEVFAGKESVRQNEFYQAYQSGFQTTAMFKLWVHEYNDERVLLHKKKYHTIIRSYEDGDYVYLTCTKRRGVFDEAVRV